MKPSLKDINIKCDIGPTLWVLRTAAGSWIVDEDQERPCFRVLAMRGGRRVGSLCYEQTLGGIESIGTFVSSAYRRRQLALCLWVIMLERTRPKTVRVTVASDRGLLLIESLQRRYPRIAWHISEAGMRKLRGKKGYAA